MMDDAPRVDVRHVSLVKDGHAPDENEDATGIDADAWPVHMAVSDGATESAFSGLWARRLAAACVARRVDTADRLHAILPQVQRTWRDEVARRVSNRPWYVTAKAEDGAFATCLAVSVHADGTWRAVAVGDSVLLHVRDGTLRRAWPLDDPAAFDDRPALLPSREPHPVPTIEETTGRWAPGDTLALATDAVGQWLLRTAPTDRLAHDETAMQEAIRAARTTGTLRNDDSTIVWLRVGV